MSAIYRLTLDVNVKQDAHGHKLYYVGGVRDEIAEQNEDIRLSTTVLDQAILEAASGLGKTSPLDYLLGCWKRVSRQYKSFRTTTSEDPKFAIIKEARRLCMSYCIFAVTMPEMFGHDPPATNPLTPHLLVDPEDDRGICHDFLSEAVSRWPDDDTVQEAVVGAIEDLSRQLGKMTMNDNYKPYVLVSLILSTMHGDVTDCLKGSPQSCSISSDCQSYCPVPSFSTL